jgi:hypothetical protein
MRIRQYYASFLLSVSTLPFIDGSRQLDARRNTYGAPDNKYSLNKSTEVDDSLLSALKFGRLSAEARNVENQLSRMTWNSAGVM